MKRRAFLGIVGKSAALSLVPVSLLAGPASEAVKTKSVRRVEQKRRLELEPDHEYGNMIAVERAKSGYVYCDNFDQVVEMLLKNAREILPPGTRAELRAKIPTDFGRHCGLAWYYHPKFRKPMLWRPRINRKIVPSMIRPDGYLLFGRFVA